MKEKKFYNLDSLNGLRGIAALIIVLFHYNKLTGTAHSDVNFPFFRILKIGYTQGGWLVELFFMISGICFYAFYAKKFLDKKVTIGEFLIKRYIKLCPLYIITTIITVICQFLHKVLHGVYFENNLDLSFRSVLLNLLGIARGWFDNASYPYNAPAWFLSVLFFVYILFSVICSVSAIMDKYKEKVLLILTGICMGLGVIIRAENLQYAVFNVEIGRGLGSFFGGGILYYILEKTNKSGQKNRLIIWSSLIFAAGSMTNSVLVNSRFEEIVWIPFVLFPYIIICSVSLNRMAEILECTVFMKLSRLSYYIYLMQYPIFILFKLVGEHLEWNYYSIFIWLMFWLSLISASFFVAYIDKKLFQKFRLSERKIETKI